MPTSPDPAAADTPSTLWRSHPAYRRFWFARVAAGLGYQMQAVAVGWQIYAITHSTLKLGLVGLAQFLPMLLLTLPAGHVADKHDRRTVAALALAVQGLSLAFLAAGSAAHWITAPEIFAAVAIMGAARAFERPATQALMPGLVPASLLPKAIAWSSAAFQSACIIGPAFGGFLYHWGPAVPHTVEAALVLAAAGWMASIRVRASLRSRQPATLRTLFAGVAYIRGNPVVLGSISLDLFAVLLGGATALLPAYASDILKVGSTGLGALRAAPAVGSLLMSAFLARRPLERRMGPRMFAAVFAFGLATIIFGLSRSFPLSFAALLVLGAADIVSVVVRSSLVQIQTPDDMRGRVGAVNSLFIGTSNQLGEFESGITAWLMGTVAATVVGGVGTLVVAALWMRFFPSLARFDRIKPQAASCDRTVKTS